MNEKIEILKKDDIGSFYQVFAQAIKTLFPCYTPKMSDFFLNKVYTPTNFIYWINNDFKTIFVVRINKEIVGFAVVDQPYGGVSFCRWLAVLPKFQKQGLGRKLIMTWIDFSRSQGCHKVELASQPLAKAFYEKIGLSLEGERKMSYFGSDQFIFGKIIGLPNEDSIIKFY